MISISTARACAASVASRHNATIVDPDDARPWLTALETAAELLLGGGATSPLATLRDSLTTSAARVAGLAVPTPWVTLVLLSERALTDGAAYLETVAHELVHADQATTVGAGQVAVDYLHPELRAHREGDAGGVSLWVRYLVTGVRPSPDDAGVVTSSLYHLSGDQRAFGRAVVETSLVSIDTAAVPPHRVARDVLAWLRAHAPEAILAPEYRAPRGDQ